MFDIIVLATGFQVSQFLALIEIYGWGGIFLNKQSNESRSAQVYYGTFVHNFPNLGIMLAFTEEDSGSIQLDYF